MIVLISGSGRVYRHISVRDLVLINYLEGDRRILWQALLHTRILLFIFYKFLWNKLWAVLLVWHHWDQVAIISYSLQCCRNMLFRSFLAFILGCWAVLLQQVLRCWLMLLKQSIRKVCPSAFRHFYVQSQTFRPRRQVNIWWRLILGRRCWLLLFWAEIARVGLLVSNEVRTALQIMIIFLLQNLAEYVRRSIQFVSQRQLFLLLQVVIRRKTLRVMVLRLLRKLLKLLLEGYDLPLMPLIWIQRFWHRTKLNYIIFNL